MGVANMQHRSTMKDHLGGQELLPLIQYPDCLRPVTLDLSFRFIDDILLKNISEKLKQSSLIYINLSHNLISDAGAKVLAEVMIANPKLTNIILDSNRIGDEGASYLANAISKNKYIKTISLKHNRITDDGAVTLLCAILSIATNDMIWFVLENNLISKTGEDYLVRALKDKNIIYSVRNRIKPINKSLSMKPRQCPGLDDDCLALSNKISLLELLPSEILYLTLSMCNYEEQNIASTLVRTNKYFYNLLQPQRLLDKLFMYLASEQKEQASQIKFVLVCHPYLLTQRKSFIDSINRNFHNLSAFEYAIWSLNTDFICDEILNYIPKDDKGIKLKNELLLQLKYIQEHGVTYTLDGEEHTESHYNFIGLISALEHYANEFDKWNWGQRQEYWFKRIEVERNSAPKHIAQLFSYRDNFYSPQHVTKVLKKLYKLTQSDLNLIESSLSNSFSYRLKEKCCVS